MTSLVKAYVIFEAPLVAAFLIVAILAYRSKRTIASLLLMWASICYFLPSFVPFVIALFGYALGWKSVPAGLLALTHSWWPFIVEGFRILFLSLIIASLIFFIRERKEIVVPEA